MDMNHDFDVDSAVVFDVVPERVWYPETVVIALVLVGAWLPILARGFLAFMG